MTDDIIPGGRPFTGRPKPISLENKVFLDAVFQKDAWRAHVTGFPEDPTQLDVLGLRHYWGGGTAKDLLHRFHGDDNTFFTISVFNPDPVDGRYRRRKVAFDRTYAIVFDDVNLDMVPWEQTSAKVAEDKIKEKPSWTLETSPNNFQLGYILQGGDDRGGKVNALLNALVDSGLVADGTDPGQKGVTRYVRLPTGTNTKKKYGTQGFRHSLRSWRPERKYTLEQLADAHGLRAELDAADDAIGAGGAPKTVDPDGDWILDVLSKSGRVLSEDPAKKLWHVECPFVDEHTGRANSGAAYLGDGLWCCHHGHCCDRDHGDFTERLREMFPDESTDAVHRVAVREFDDGLGETYGDKGVPERVKAQEEFEEVRDLFGEERAQDNLEKRQLGPFQTFMDDGFTMGSVIAEGIDRANIWNLPDVLPLQGVGIHYADTGAGKSFVMLDMMARMVTGMLWHGMPFRAPGLCLYVSSEGGSQGTKRRVHAWVGEHGWPGSPGDEDMYVLPKNFSFGPGDIGEKQAGGLIQWLNLWSKRTGKRVAMVVVDTLNRNMTGDENATQDAAAVLNLCYDIADRARTFVWLVHHTGKDSDKGPRGSSTISRNTDVVLRGERDKSQGLSAVGRLILEKTKDGEIGVEWFYRLKQVKMGRDNFGGELTSAVIVEEAAPANANPPTSKEMAVIAAYNDLAPFGTEAVSLGDVCKEARDKAVSGQIKGLKRGGRYAPSEFKRAAKGLAEKGIMKVDLEADKIEQNASDFTQIMDEDAT